MRARLEMAKACGIFCICARITRVARKALRMAAGASKGKRRSGKTENRRHRRKSARATKIGEKSVKAWRHEDQRHGGSGSK